MLVGVSTSRSETNVDGSEGSSSLDGSSGASEGLEGWAVDDDVVIVGGISVGLVDETESDDVSSGESGGSSNVGTRANGGVLGVFVVFSAGNEGSRSDGTFCEWNVDFTGGRDDSLSSRHANGGFSDNNDHNGLGG